MCFTWNRVNNQTHQIYNEILWKEEILVRGVTSGKQFQNNFYCSVYEVIIQRKWQSSHECVSNKYHVYRNFNREFLHRETNIICMIHIAFSFNVKLKTPNTHYMFDSYITKNIKHIIIRFKFIGIISLLQGSIEIASNTNRQRNDMISKSIGVKFLYKIRKLHNKILFNI